MGVLLFEALAGQPAFSAETPLALVASISSGVPIPLNQVRDGIEPAVVATVERAMAMDPDGRFDSATTMAAALGAATRQSAPATADAPTVPAASGPALRVPPTLPERAVGSTAPRAAMPRVAPTEVLVDAKSAVPAKPTKFRRRSKPRAAVLAGLLVFLAAGLFATRELSDGGQTPAKPASTTTTPGGNTIPTPLQRALDELDRSVRP